MAKSYYYGLGKRKTSIAKVRMYENGSGNVTINGESINSYFFGLLIENALAPLARVDQLKKVDVEVMVTGGGKSSQSDAVRHGISRALLVANPEHRSDLKQAGFLRRDSRIKERKKPGLHRARRAPQFAKR